MDWKLRAAAAFKVLFETEGHGPPRDLTDLEWRGWSDAQDRRAAEPLRPRTLDEVKAAIRHRNPIKWRYIQSDYKWLQRQMKRMGLNPEDARYLL